jgi:hypothetical protein
MHFFIYTGKKDIWQGRGEESSKAANKNTVFFWKWCNGYPGLIPDTPAALYFTEI